MARPKYKEYADVWEALDISPAERQNLRVRSRLMDVIEDIIKERQLTQAQAAKLFGVSQPRVSDLMRGRIDKFSIDALVEWLSRAGYKVRISLEKAA
jgi:predicted XRE-type DNA-binding protein